MNAPDAGEKPLPIARPVIVGRKRKRKPPHISRWIRLMLALMALGLIAVFSAAAWIRPYDEDGNARKMATHTQLGLEPCNMVVATGKPCPACGMTTSFALLMHADPLASLRANWVGTLLALAWLALIPWGILSAVRGRLIWIRRGELWLTVGVSILLMLMIGRWLVIFFG
jgi:hypothetical protein